MPVSYFARAMELRPVKPGPRWPWIAAALAVAAIVVAMLLVPGDSPPVARTPDAGIDAPQIPASSMTDPLAWGIINPPATTRR